jgi:uncharacterized membrane protein
MRKLLKFLHTLGGIGLLGAMLALLVLHANLPSPQFDLAGYVAVRNIMDALAQAVLLPSLGVTIVAGLLSMAAVPAYHGAGWVWAKLATGILMFEGTLLGVQGPLEREAIRARALLSDPTAADNLALNLSAEVGSIWVLGAVAIVNVALAVWRPKKRRKSVAQS